MIFLSYAYLALDFVDFVYRFNLMLYFVDFVHRFSSLLNLGVLIY